MDTPKPKRVLTDEEISELWYEAEGHPFKFARLIEKKLHEHDPR